MALSTRYANYYQEVGITTANPFELILILYNGALDQLRQARAHFQFGRTEARAQAITKAIAMIGELQAALDFEKGQQIARDLNRLYTYMLRQLTQANLRKEPAKVEEVMKLLEILRSAWEEARVQYASQNIPKPGKFEAVAG